MIYIVGDFFNSLHFAFVTFLAVIKYPDEIQVRGKEFILAYSSSGDLVQHGRKAYGIGVRKQSDPISSIHWK